MVATLPRLWDSITHFTCLQRSLNPKFATISRIGGTTLRKMASRAGLAIRPPQLRIRANWIMMRLIAGAQAEGHLSNGGTGMLKETMQNALNEQINREFYAFYLYLAMAAHFKAENLTGFAGWMRVQSEEEYGHAMRIFQFINERSGQVTLLPIAAPPPAFGPPLAVFEQALAHERQVTEWINQIYEQAIQEHDYATRVHLQWFVTEQVEEEAVLTEMVDKLKRAGDNQSALLLLDRDLSQRTRAGLKADQTQSQR